MSGQSETHEDSEYAAQESRNRAADLADSELQLDFTGRVARDQVLSVTSALATLPDSSSRTKAKLLAKLAIAQVPLDRASATETAHTAAHVAADTGDEVARAYALIAESVADLSPQSLTRRIDLARSALDISVRSGHRALAPTSYFLLLGALTEASDIEAVDRELAPKTTSLGAFSDLLDGRHATWFRCLRATLDGRADEAQQLADTGYALAERDSDPDALIVWAGQTAVIRWMQGRVAEMEPMLLQARQGYPGEPVWAAAVAWIWARQGRTDAAAAVVASMPPLASFPHDRNWLAAVAILADVAAELGTATLVAELHDALAVYADRLVAIGLGVTCWGTVARPLALLARRAGDTGAAIDYYRRAIDVCSRLGAQVWLAEAQCELAELLLSTDDDPSEAATLAAQAASAAGHLGLREIEDRTSCLLDSLLLPARERDASERYPDPRPVPGVPRVRVLAGFSVLTAAGEEVLWRSRKARQLLKILIARRGAPIPREQLLEFLWPGMDPSTLTNRLAVAVSTVRSALDPSREHPRDHFLAVDRHVVALNIGRLWVDSESFLRQAEAALRIAEERRALGRQNEAHEHDPVEAAVASYLGSALPEEPYAAWAESLRREVDGSFCAVAHALAVEASDRGEHVARIDLYRRILDLDEYDQVAHEGLVDALTAVGAHGQAQQAHTHAHAKLAELGIEFG